MCNLCLSVHEEKLHIACMHLLYVCVCAFCGPVCVEVPSDRDDVRVCESDVRDEAVSCITMMCVCVNQGSEPGLRRLHANSGDNVRDAPVCAPLLTGRAPSLSRVHSSTPSLPWVPSSTPLSAMAAEASASAVPTGPATVPAGTATGPAGTATVPAGTATGPAGTATVPAGAALEPPGNQPVSTFDALVRVRTATVRRLCPPALTPGMVCRRDDAVRAAGVAMTVTRRLLMRPASRPLRPRLSISVGFCAMPWSGSSQSHWRRARCPSPSTLQPPVYVCVLGCGEKLGLKSVCVCVCV